MIRLGLFFSTALAVLIGSSSLNSSACRGDDKKDEKGIVVVLDALQSTTPADWVEEKPSNRMRFKQFKLAKVKDDKEDAQIIISKGIGGSAKDNIQRWKGQFILPEGKKPEEGAKVSEFEVSGAKVNYLDIQGTYKQMPFEPGARPEMKPDFRMLAAQLDGKDNVFHIKLVGPAKTVEHYQKGFEEWLKAFK